MVWDISLSEEEAVGVRKKRTVRIRNRKRNLPLRILKYDIRRQYAQMFINVINNSDETVIHRFFRSIASPDVTIDKRCPTLTPLIFLSDVNVQGISQAALYWTTILKVVPDAVYTVENVRIITSSDSDECRITCTVHASFTNYCMISAPTIAMQKISYQTLEIGSDRNLSSGDNASTSTGSNSSTIPENCTNPNRSYMVPYEAIERCEPWSMLITSTLTMYINDRKQITKFLYEHPICVY